MHEGVPLYEVPAYRYRHPAQPDLPLRAGEALRRGDLCWINEDGTVWRVDPIHLSPVIDGLAVIAYRRGDAVILVTEAWAHFT